MPRAQNAHAYVNAGFRLQFNNETGNVERATLVYGGINPSVSLRLFNTIVSYVFITMMLP